jgi:hypothetical protein
VVKCKKNNNYQDLPWNNTIEEDTICYPDLFAGGKGINVWPIVIIYFKDAKMFRCNYYTNINMSDNNKYIRLKNM